ncbi:MAG: ImmA/IrrE family metallo-endopeptidase [Vicinamibacterales bacterium]
MQVRRSRGRRFSDPDVVSLIDRSGHAIDPYVFVEQQAKDLLDKMAAFEGHAPRALDRIRHLASLAGFEVSAMDETRARGHERDAVLVATKSPGRRGRILYNPYKTEARTVHSIAHEITHSFFPNSDVGAQFRSVQRSGVGPAPELELLCDYGAAELTMPRGDFMRAIEEIGFGLEYIEQIRRRFGTSFEATAYRIATTSQLPVAVGLFCYRYAKGEVGKPSQGVLFPAKQPDAQVTPKYRRQSFHHSRVYPPSLVLPWNKSLPIDGAAYRAARSGKVESATEILEARTKVSARFLVQAVPAPYQPEGVDAKWPNMLVLLTLLQ